jgi:hypothetical protein
LCGELSECDESDVVRVGSGTRVFGKICDAISYALAFRIDIFFVRLATLQIAGECLEGITVTPNIDQQLSRRYV